MTFEEFVQKVDAFYHVNQPDLRYGQSIMNTLYNVWSDKYNEITNTDFDCFYDDRTAKFTLEKLEKEWVDS
jgi:hypothetical protein